jgi:hypothetical protein
MAKLKFNNKLQAQQELKNRKLDNLTQKKIFEQIEKYIPFVDYEDDKNLQELAENFGISLEEARNELINYQNLKNK